MVNPHPSGFSWWALLPPLAGLLVFGQVLGFGLVEYDDPAFLSGNPHVRHGLSKAGLVWACMPGDMDGLRPGVGNLWHPLAWMSHMIDYSMWGDHYGAHHATSLALFLATSVLVFLLARNLSGSSAAALAASLLFTLHPLQAESVAWLSDRKGVLGNFFLFASLLAYAHGGGQNRAWKPVSVVLAIAAMLSKPTTVVLPALLMVIDFWSGKRAGEGNEWIRRSVLTKWPWFAPAIALSLWAIALQTGGSHGAGPIPFAERFALLPLNFFHAIVRMVIPWRLAMHYPTPDAGGFTLAASWISFLAVPLLFARRGWSLALGGWLWMLLAWLPVSGLIYVGTSFSTDRYAAFMWAGPCLAFALWLGREKNRSMRPGVLATSLGLGVLFATLAYHQTATWRSTRALYEHARLAQPGDKIIANNHAGMLLAEGEVAEAETAFRDAIRKFPRFARLHFNHGLALARLGREKEAELAYRDAIALDPASSDAWLNLGLLRGRAHPAADEQEIIDCLEKAISLAPPGDLRPRLALAHRHISRGENARALSILDAMPAPLPGDTESARLAVELRSLAGPR